MTAVILGTSAPRAGEGFWLFSKPPLDLIEQHHGIRPPAAVLDRLQRSVVRFKNLDGGSGAFVSADGLVATNLHVLGHYMGLLVKIPGVDVGLDGFYAKTLEEEVKIPTLTLDAVEGETDVTSEVLARIPKGLAAREEEEARRQAAAGVAQAAEPRDGTIVEVTALNAGAQYLMYRYRRYSDIRLVLAPELRAGFPASLYPAPSMDFLFLRAYENGRPAHPAAFLEWSRSGPREGDQVFAAGFPTFGLGGRHRPLAGFEMQRDVVLPLLYAAYTRIEQRHAQWSELSADNRAAAARGEVAFFPLALDYKIELKGIRDEAFFAQRKREEERVLDALRTRGDEKALQDHASYRAAVAALAADYARGELVAGGAPESLPPWSNQRVWGREFMGRLVSYGQVLLRRHQETMAPDDGRRREVTDLERKALEEWLLAPAPCNASWEVEAFTVYLELLLENLPSTEPVVELALAGKSPRERAGDLVRATKLGDPAFRKALYEADSKTFEATKDSLLDLLRALEPEFRRIGLAYEAEKQRLADTEPAVVRAMASIDGVIAYPDPTTTLRLGYGAVAGFAQRTENFGRKVSVPPVTTLATLFEWNAHNPIDLFHFAIPDRWRDAERIVEQRAILNFASTTDLSFGNSGSPTVDREGRLIGLLAGMSTLNGDDYAKWAPDQAAIHVATPAIIEVVKHVFGATRIAEELGQIERK